MTAKTSAEMRNALSLVYAGMTAREAALQAGVREESLYRHPDYKWWRKNGSKVLEVVPGTGGELGAAIAGLEKRRATEGPLNGLATINKAYISGWLDRAESGGADDSIGRKSRTGR